MLPLPTIDFVPKLMRDYIDSVGVALTGKMDTFLESLIDDVKLLGYLLSPDRCPAIVLDEFGYFLSADLQANDTEQQKRQKIFYAVQAHKNRSLFTSDIKAKIDIVAGGDSQIVHPDFTGDFILMGRTDTDPVSTYWATLGGDGIDDDLGMTLIGTGLEIEVQGNIYIDVDNPALTADEVARIEQNIFDVKPVYVWIHLGFISAGVFVEYDYT